MRYGLLLALLFTSACASLPERVVIPAVPYVDHRVLLMDALDDDTDICTLSHAYTGHPVLHCATLREVRTFLNGHTLANE